MRVADGPGRWGLAHRPARPALTHPTQAPAVSSGLGHLLSGLSPSQAHAGQLRPQTQPLRAAFHLSPEADAVFSNSTICFLPPLCLFIYLLLVLKTKIVFLFSALETGGQMEELCVQRQDQVVPGVCVLVCGVWCVNPLGIQCHVLCVCEHVCYVGVCGHTCVGHMWPVCYTGGCTNLLCPCPRQWYFQEASWQPGPGGAEAGAAQGALCPEKASCLRGEGPGAKCVRAKV